MNRPSDPEPSARDDAGEALSLALRQGADVLDAWYRAVWPQVHRLCSGLLASSAEADDVAQDAMLHLVDRLDRWNPERPFGAWRQRVVVNLCRDHLRSAKRRQVHEEEAGLGWHEAQLPEPSAAAESAEVSQLVDRCLGLLPPREREVFVLVDLEGQAPADAAELLGIAASTVRAALTLARRRMREALAPHLPDAQLEGGPA